MKRLNNKGYLTIEIILAAVIAFTIAFFLIEITVNFSNASDNYYTDTIFITDKSLVTNNVKKNIQNDINDNGLINNVTCNDNKCIITYENNTTKELKYNNGKVEYDTYSKEVKNLTFKSINVYGSYNEGDYIRFVISFDNTFTNNNYDINILIKNEENVIYELLVEHIKNLYDDNKDTTVTNNNIEYQYATSVNLMNDRLGGTTSSLDGGNIRYYGANPNNYIDIGDRTSENGVIPWRIIGVFDGKVRIVRDESIGMHPWDDSPDGVNKSLGINQWGPSSNYTGADLMKLLNPGYETNTDFDYEGNQILIDNSLYWNSEKGKCYGYDNISTKINGVRDCDFRSIGLSSEAKEKIIEQTVYLGGYPNNDIYSAHNIYPDQIYKIEREGNIVKSGENCNGIYCNDDVVRTNEWSGMISLMYPSDFGYAVDFNKCDSILRNIGATYKCKENIWLKSNQSIHFITPVATGGYGVLTYRSYLSGYAAEYSINVFPTLTLSPDFLIKSTDEGTDTDPYVVVKP